MEDPGEKVCTWKTDDIKERERAKRGISVEREESLKLHPAQTLVWQL